MKPVLQGTKEYFLRHKMVALLLSALACYLPFINKPFHIDDPFFLYAARAINIAPFNPFSVDSYYDLWSSNFNSVFFYYYPAVLRAVAGESEIGMHGGYLVFYLGAGVLFFLLCRSLKIRSMIPALLFLFSPLSLLTATSIMSDFPFVFFLLAAVYCHVKAMERNDDLLLIILSVVAAACAMLTKYYGALILIPMVYLAAARRKYKYLIFLMVPLALSAAGDLVFSRGREAHVLYVFGKLGWIHSPLRKETVSFLTTLGGVAIFPLSCLAFIGRCPKRWAAYIVSLLTVEFALLIAGWKIGAVISGSIYILNSCILFVLVAARTRDAVKAKDHLLASMGVWFFSYTLFLMLFPNIMAARYVLPLLPPLLIFFFLEADLRFAPSIKGWFMPATLFMTLLLGIALNTADYKLADAYRTFARDAKEHVSNERTGFIGDYAFAYYLQKSGFAKYDPSKHDSLLIAKYGSAHAIYGGNEYLKDMSRDFSVETAVNARADCPLRVWDPTAFAGFHLNMFGYIPWGISQQPLDVFLFLKRRINT